jgi:hypothetical protein
MPIHGPDIWPALALAVALMTLGGVFILAPELGATIFGLAAPEGSAAAWLAVVGLRDLVFGGYVFALALLSTRRAVGVVLGMTTLIPLGDILVLIAIRGVTSPGHLLVHLASACAVAITAAWTLRHTRPPAG